MSLVGLVVLVFAYSRVIPRPSSQSCLSFLLRSRWVAVMFDASSPAARAHAALAEPVYSALFVTLIGIGHCKTLPEGRELS